MKAILKFDLDDRCDRMSFNRATNATEVYLVLHELNEELRKVIKYDDNMTKVKYYEDIREKLNELLDVYHITMDDLE